MDSSLSFDALKKKQHAAQTHFPETMRLRVHRAISWIGRAESCGDDHDARFIFFWIAFNAAYAQESDFQGNTAFGERSSFNGFFKKLVDLDKREDIYNALWDRFSGPLSTLMKNRYVFRPFWQYHNGLLEYHNWEALFREASYDFEEAFQKERTARVLSFVFDRLYVLRNQLVHGGATWNSRVNRAQVRDGAAILAFLLPTFVLLMMEHPKEDWGKPFYPVVD